MNVGAVYYTNDMHALYTDRYFQNPVMVEGSPAKYYNYYEFLPLRSRTKFNGDQLNGFLNSRGYNEVAYDYDHLQSNQSKMVNSGWFFVNAQETYGVNALLAFCMGLLESGWGRSSIAVSYTHLDVYKRQELRRLESCRMRLCRNRCLSRRNKAGCRLRSRPERFLSPLRHSLSSLPAPPACPP